MLQHNITYLQQRINKACMAFQRDADSVSLLAVSKTQPAEIIQQAYDLGLCHFGENYANEAQEKIPALAGDIIWHFIGPVQSNKTRFIAENFTWLHSLDRLKIAKRLHDQRPEHLPALQCLIQVNVSNDDKKSGITVDQLPDFIQQLRAYPRLKLRGLMAIPAFGQSEQDLAEDFATMQQLFKQLQQQDADIDTLSMGMSGDLELAIQYGSTMVRVGTDLFGART